MNSIKNKIFAIFIVVIVVSLSVVGWFGFKSTKESYISSELEINQGKTRSLSNQITGILGTIHEDVIYNANFYALEKLLIWEDLKERKKIEIWKSTYISVLKDYLFNKKLYYQVRILDIHGNEKILLKYNETTNKIIQTKDDDLQNKVHRNYFMKALKLKKGEFYISKMNLNVEYGEIEKPYVPVVRYSTPIIDANNQTKGVIVLNFNASKILNEILTTMATDESNNELKYYLLNEDGYYLFNKNKNKTWGFQLGSDYKFQNDYKDIFENFKDNDEVTFIKNNKIFSMHKIYPNKMENKYRFWYLVTVIDEDVALSSLNNFISIFAIILILVLVIGLFIINHYISKLVNPLIIVTKQLNALSVGEIRKENIVYSAKDEIGEIVHSTTILVDAIETTILQAKAVSNGDFSNEIKLLGKNDSLGLAIKEMTDRLKEIALLSSSLANGNYDVKIIAKSSRDDLGLALMDMVSYLEQITLVAESISLGELDLKYELKGKDDRLGIAILDMISYLRTILQQANAISKEDFSTSIEAKSKNDELGLALNTMTTMLRNSSSKNKQENYFNEGIGRFSDKLSSISDSQELAKEAITMLCRYVNASCGVLYTYDTEKKELNLISSFAFNSRDKLSNNYKLGEDIVGQVGLEKEPILLKNIKDNDYYIQSATTSAKPKEIYTFPLIHDGELFGVIEIMSFNSFTKINKDYLHKAGAIFATSLHTTSQNMQIKMLLEKSQEAFEELQTQSEELQESNIQMEEQRQQLTIQSKDLQVKNETLAQAKEEINTRAQELEKASKYKSEFLANMSHELRTPLNSIILLSKILMQNQNETLNDKDIEKSNVIYKAGNDLLLLINDILDLSKIESGNMELIYENLESSLMVEEMQGLFAVVAQEKNVQFIINDEYKDNFSTDKVKLAQVLKNLLSNAFKFTKEGSITLSIIEKDTFIEIAIQDTGIGIPQNKLQTIFEAFKQVDGSISREFGGTGLGLSISKTIVDLMKGNIIVTSQENMGSKFTIKLPLIKNKEIRKIENNNNFKQVSIEPTFELNEKAEIFSSFDENSDLENTNEFNGKNILIVDDDSRNIFTLTSTLEDLNAEVFSAFNGQEALEILEEDADEIDIILMDIMMPVMDGLKAMEAIRKNVNFKDIPIIAITANTMPEDKQKCLDYGANDYLAKPLEHSALISMIKAWIR